MRKTVLIFVAVSFVAGAAFMTATPAGSALTKRLLDKLGVARLERVYEAKPGSKTVFAPDPSRKVAWVDGDLSGGQGIGDGPGGTWSADIYRGGIVGFADGSSAGFSHLELRGDVSGTGTISN